MVGESFIKFNCTLEYGELATLHKLLFYKSAYPAADPSGVVDGFALQFTKQ
jgi:hypothetical protein